MATARTASRPAPDMRYRQLGATGLTVSELALGSWLTYGSGVDRDTSRACIRRAFDRGINFFDTANMYGKGEAETLLGELLASYRRDDYVLATKVYFPMSDTDYGLSRQQILKQIDASLERLGTDYVDIYYCHRYDDDTPLDETMRALSDVIAAGKVRHAGFSRWKPRQIRASRDIPGAVRFACGQSQYSLLHRRPERRVFPLCRELDIAQIAYSPLAQGALSGKYPPGGPPPAGSRAADPRSRRTSRRLHDRNILEAVQRLRPIAETLHLTIAELALAWVLRNDDVTAAVIGASRPEQIDENLGALDAALDEEALDAIDRALGDVVRH